MTRVPMEMSTVHAYTLAADAGRSCPEISSIYLVRGAEDRRVAKVVARIPASSTRQGHNEVAVDIRVDGSAILDSTCTCPVGGRCKHVHKVLCRIAKQEPIGKPDRETRQRTRSLANRMEHASVYLAFACKLKCIFGHSWVRDYYDTDKCDQVLLGVFVSLSQANQCARAYVQKELGVKLPGKDDAMEDDDEEFEYASSEFGEYEDNDDDADKVWVERRAIEDASPQFRP